LTLDNGASRCTTSNDAAPAAAQGYPATVWYLLMLGLITLASACSSNEPRRHANFQDGQDPNCIREYARLDTTERARQ
jgi:hypothetical protein